MIIDDADGSENEDVAMTDIGGAAYRESATSVDGFTRGPNGRIKFNKDTKKRRREIQEIEDETMADGDDGTTKSNKSERKANIRLGHEFKAKVGLFRTLPPILLSYNFNRKQGEMSKKEAWILMRSCRCHKPPRKAHGESVPILALLVNVDLHDVKVLYNITHTMSDHKVHRKVLASSCLAASNAPMGDPRL
jgi:hypothetical protein